MGLTISPTIRMFGAWRDDMPSTTSEEETQNRIDPRDLAGVLLSMLSPNYDFGVAGFVGTATSKAIVMAAAREILRRARRRDIEDGERVKINVVKSKLSEYLHRVEMGEAFVITNGDDPVAMLRPLPPHHRTPGSLAHLVGDDQYAAARAFFSGEGREAEYAAAEGFGKEASHQTAADR